MVWERGPNRGLQDSLWQAKLEALILLGPTFLESAMAKKKSTVFWIDRNLPHSPAWESLNGTAKDVLLHFYLKRRMEDIRTRRKRDWEITNNGELEYSYKEAEANGISRPTFARTIGQLVDHGFLDITRLGSLPNHATWYSLSYRWLQYGTPQFVSAIRPRRPVPAGNPRAFLQVTSALLGQVTSA